MAQTVETLFDEGIQRYKAGESAADLIPFFKEICDRAPKNSAAWTCLAWLYLLNDKPNAGYKAAQKAVKLNPQDPQARINLSIAILDSDRSGVREHVDMASRVITAVDELKTEIQQNLEEGLSRKPDWKNLQKVQKWILGS
ncbi:MAG: tetratricopeptide repeat protein [Cyanobacteria bacterium P01_A01_bin.114]